jgi:hypothetical protein
MKVVPPMWELRAPCPCCGQGGLWFATCPACHHVVLICADLGTVFPDPRDLARPSPQPYGGDAACPSCGVAPLREYLSATSDQIQALGFALDEYQ